MPALTFTLWKTLTPPDRYTVIQHALPYGADWYTAQAKRRLLPGGTETDDLVVTRYVGETAADQMHLPAGGHNIDEITKDGLTLKFTVCDDLTGKVLSESWVCIPWRPGHTWTPQEASVCIIPAPPTVAPPARSWLQGEATHDGTTWRLYGVPYVNSGPLYPDQAIIPGLLETIEDGKVVDTLSVAMLGRGTDGKPVDGKLEPEGLSVHTEGETTYLLLGICVGNKGEYRIQVYRAAIAEPPKPVPPPESLIEAWPAWIRVFEGYLNGMYLDTKGLVTTGVGFLIDSVNAAQALPWKNRIGKFATAAEVEAEWRKIKARTDLKAKGGYAYKPLFTLFLDDADIDKLTVTKARQFQGVITGNYPDYPRWPADAQLAVLDMGWNYGPHFTDSGWPNFAKALGRQDWIAAGVHCISGDPKHGRNVARVRLFTNAARVRFAGLDTARLWNETPPMNPLKGRTALAALETANAASAFANPTKVGTNAFYVQRMLSLLGYYTGPLDGLAGPQTAAAFAAFAKARKIANEVTAATLTRLSTDSGLLMPVVA